MITAARIPASHLVVLASLRAEGRIRIHAAGDGVWVRWPAELGHVLDALRPVPGVELFEQRSPRWYRAGRRIPSTLEPPLGDGDSLMSHLAPARFTPIAVESGAATPVSWVLRRGGTPQVATAMRCDLAAFQSWVNLATTAELAAVKAAHTGGVVRLLGTKLPSIAGGVRYSGQRLFIPLGWVVDPDPAEAMLISSIGLAADELAFLDGESVEIISRTVFHPLTRAGVRQAAI